MENTCGAHLPLVPFGQIWKNRALAADRQLLENIKSMLLSRINFDAKEIIRVISQLSRWTKTPVFYSQLLYRTVTLCEEYELSSFLIDQNETLVRESFMTVTSMSVLHLIALQRNPVLALAEKILHLCPATASSCDIRGETPLHIALQAETPNVALVALMLKHNPTAATVKSSNGQLPIHMLFARNAEYPCLSCLRLLLQVKTVPIEREREPSFQFL
jgi:ankyrin repeat protein